MSGAARIATTVPVLGVPVRFESNDVAVLDAVERAYAPGAAPDEPAASVRIDVVAGEGLGVGFEVCDGDLLVVSGDGCRGTSDFTRREAVAEVTGGLLADDAGFARGVLDALTLWIVTGMDREPLHAAAVAEGRSALLLAGESGAGKSTTVYACARAGVRVLAEDAVYLQLFPFRVWGMARAVHLLPDARRFFPELAALPTRPMPNGKTKLVVDLPRPSGAREPIDRAAVCLLARGGPPGIERVSADEVAAALTRAPAAGFDRFAESIGPRVRRLSEGGGWRMTLPPDPRDVPDLVREMLRAV